MLPIAVGVGSVDRFASDLHGDIQASWRPAQKKPMHAQGRRELEPS
jgi:hypothetical protein